MATTTCESRYPKLIDSLLLEPLGPAKWHDLRAHVAGCDACRERYNRVSLAERMLHGGPAAMATPSASTLDRIGAAVCGGEARPAAAKLGGLAAVPRWAFSVFALGVTAALLPMLLKAPIQPATHAEFQARGEADGDEAQRAGLRAFCLKPEVVPLPSEGGGATCGANELLKFTYSNRAGYEDLFLVGVDEQYAIKWYEPRPPSAISVPAAREVDQPVAGAIKVGVNHAPGGVRVFALFAHAPLAAREIEAAVDELRRRGTPIREATSLPLAERADVLQRTLLLEISR